MQLEELLRRLALNDERAVGTATGAAPQGAGAPVLDPKTRSLVRLGALLSVGAPTASCRVVVDGARGVDAHRGLSDEEAAERLARNGPNKFAEAAKEPRWRAFVRQYEDLMQVVLVIAGVGSLALGELGTGLVILSLTLLNAVLGL